MAEVYAIDFETYWDDACSVITLGPEAYVAHPFFHTICVAIHGAQGPVFSGLVSDAPWDEILKPDNLLLAHNARFDKAVATGSIEMAHLAETIAPVSWFCTADMAVNLGAGRSLKEAVADLLGEVISKDERTASKGKDLQYFQTHPEKFKSYIEYCARDAAYCYRLWETGHEKWAEDEQELSRMNRRIGSRGIYIDTPALDKSVDTLSTLKWEAGKQIPWEWDGKKTPLSYISAGKQCRSQGIPPPPCLAEKNEGFIAWETKYSGQVPWVKSLRDWRKINRLEKILKTVKRRTRADGWMSYETKYFGAHTGRFSGGGGFNIQNLPRKKSYGVDLRKLIVAPPGYKLVIVDYSQIEARILLWLAGDQATLDVVRSGVNIYEAHARQTMGWTGGALDTEDPSRYSLAKARVIGLGYGAGGPKFRVLAATYGVILTEEEASRAVWDFRTSNPRILALWSILERNFKWAYQAKESFELELPSGRVLTYRDITSTGRGLRARTSISGNLTYVYGGKLVENLVQAAARDLFTNRMLAFDEAGLDILFHVHDEYVFLRPENELKTFIGIMDAIIQEANNISWIKGCPIGAKTDIVDQYTK